MDLSRFSDDDLVALKSGDLTKMSDAGLATLKNPPSEKERTLGSTALDAGKAALHAYGSGLRNLGAGAFRGAGSIGATVLTPIDAAARGLGIENDFIGRSDRRQAMDEGLSTMGADTSSLPFQAGKLATEVAGTAGVGGLLARGASAIPGVASKLPAIVDSLKTGGMSVNGAKGFGGLVARGIGGAVTGGASAGLVNPEDAKLGAEIGGLAAPGVKIAGVLGEKIGSAFTSKTPTITPEKLKTAQDAINAGYVIPPSMIEPSFVNRMIESLSGKHETAQLAAGKNQVVTEGLVRQALGLAPDAPLSKEAMQQYRKLQQAAGYEPLRQAGAVVAGPKFDSELSSIVNQYTGKGTIPGVADSAVADLIAKHRSAGFDSSDAVDAIRILREKADEAFAKGENSLGKANKALASAYEGAIDDSLQSSGQTGRLKNYRDARQNTAKSFTVEKALREGSGSVDARVIARELQKGKPLTGELQQVGQFANVFDKAAQPPHLIGSPGVNNLRTMLTTGAGGAGAAAGSALAGPIGAAIGAGIGAGSTLVAAPAARAYMFSKGAQKGLVDQSAKTREIIEMLRNSAPMGYGALPTISGP